MPVMDGPASASAMRALGVTIPIFGVTGNGSDEDIQHYMSHGATEVSNCYINIVRIYYYAFLQ